MRNRKWNSLAFYLCVFAVSTTCFAVDFTVPASVKQKYAALYQLPIQEASDGSKTFHQAKLFMRDGVRVLFLKGDGFEMAFQHGRLLKEEIHRGPIPQTSLMLEKELRNGFPKIPVISNVIINAMYRRVSEKMIDYAVNSTGTNGIGIMNDAYGMSEGSGLSVQTLLYAAVGPESLQTLLAQHLKRRERFSGSFSSECSAFAAWGDQTVDGGMIIGRNTDYPLNGYYDKFPTVFYFEPTDGSQKYMAISSAGIHNAGIVGLNENGIYLGVHTVPTSDASAEGVPAFFIAQDVLRKAKTLDEAIKLFSRFHSAAGWTYLIVDTKNKKAVSYELGNTSSAILPALTDTYHVQTNHYRTPQMKPRYLSVNLNIDRDSFSRLSRVEDLLKSQKGSLDARKAALILGDKVDYITGKVRGLGNTVSVHTTMTSAVFDIARHRVFIGAGTAPVPNTRFVEFPTVDSADSATFGRTPFETFANDSYPLNHPDLFSAEQDFIAAKIAYETDLNYPKAFSYIRKAVATDPTNPYYHFVAGILALKATDDAAAWKFFEETAALDDDHQRFLSRYYQGRIRADYNDRPAARDIFIKLLKAMPQQGDDKLRTAVQDSLKKLNGVKALRLNRASLTLMVQQADMTDY